MRVACMCLCAHAYTCACLLRILESPLLLYAGALQENPHHTYPSLMAAIHSGLRRRGHKQRPQLTSSQQFDTSKKFSLSDIMPNRNHQIGRRYKRNKKKNMAMAVGAGVVGGLVMGELFEAFLGF